jgi:serine/threonine protein kinase
MPNLVTLRPKPGDVVEGVYHVVCELGSDAHCIVLGAVVPSTGKRYALRYFLGGDGPALAASLQHFVRVANNVNLFDNPGVVEIFGIGQNAGQYYVVTEWLEGTTLERFLDRSGPMPARDAVTLLQPAMEGLAAAHAASIAHGDVRPASIFLCRATRFEAERARLYKFSAARWADRPIVARNRGSENVEIRQYVSPEELQGAFPDERSDVYSMGVLLYVMIAGRSPFSSVDVNHLAAEIVSGSFTPLSSRVAGVPREIDAAIARAMMTEPGQRQANMSELLAQLNGTPQSRRGAELARQSEVQAYTWIRPASEDSPSLFDLAPVAAEAAEARRDATSRILRTCAIVSCLVMAAAVFYRTQVQSGRAPRPAAKRQTVAAQVARDADGLAAANPLPAPDVQRPMNAPGEPRAEEPASAPDERVAPQTPAAPRALKPAPDNPPSAARNEPVSAAAAPSSRLAAPAIRHASPAPLPPPDRAVVSEENVVRGRGEALDTMRLQ